MFYTYIIQSVSNRKYYIGSTQNIDKRIKRHNSGFNKSTKNKGPFKLVYTESFPTRIGAYKRERQIKSYKGGDAFKKLVNLN